LSFRGGLVLGSPLGARSACPCCRHASSVSARVDDLLAHVTAGGSDLLIPIGAGLLHCGVGLLGVCLGELGARLDLVGAAARGLRLAARLLGLLDRVGDASFRSAVSVPSCSPNWVTSGGRNAAPACGVRTGPSLAVPSSAPACR